MKKLCLLLFPAFAFVILNASGQAAPPTDTREWKSTVGTSIEAKATAFANGVATLETPAGRVIQVPAAKLSAEDREFLGSHFPSVPADTLASGPPPSGLPHPLGTAVGPIKAPNGSYVLYLPNSMKADRKVPLLFFTHSGGGNTDRLRRLMEGAEVCGWIVAMSVESKNGPDDNFPLIESCVHHILETLPVEPERVYFSGTSGGSRQAFTNSTKIDSAGVLAFIAGGQPGQLGRKKHYFFINGATDYNRAGSAFSFAEVKSNAAMRFHPGSHSDGPDWLATEGIVWLECKWHEKSKSKSDPAAKTDFDAAALDWIEKIKATEPHRAAWWVSHLLKTGVSLPSRSRAEALTRELAGSAEAAAFAKGLADIEKFAIDVLAESPRFAPECFDYTSREIEKKVDRLLETHAATPWIKDILAALKQKTGNG